MIGVSGRMFLGDGLLLNDGNQETIYINMVAKIFPVFIAGIFLSAILAAIMSTADSQLLVTASAITEDFTTTRSARTQREASDVGLPRLRYGGSNYRCSDRNQPEQHHPVRVSYAGAASALPSVWLVLCSFW